MNMFSKDNIDAILIEVVAPRVDEVALDVFHLVLDLPKKTLLVVFWNLRYSRVRPNILLAQRVSLLSPVSLKLPDNWFLIINKGYAFLCNIFAKNLFYIEATGLKHPLQESQSNLWLSDVRTIQGVQAVDPEDSILHAEDFSSFDILHKVPEILKAWLQLGNQDLKRIILVSPAIGMKVEMQKFNLFLVLAIIDLLNIFLSEDYFPLFSIRKQINWENRTISSDNVIEMLEKGFLRELTTSSNGHILNNALLFPEHGNWSSNHCIAYNLAINLNNLLSFYEIGHIALIIYASCMEPSSSPEMTAPRD